MGDNEVAVLIVMTSIGLPMLVAIVALLTKHQQKMAKILHENSFSSEAVYRLEAQVQELRAMMMEQALTIDNLSDTNRLLRGDNPRRVTDQASISL